MDDEFEDGRVSVDVTAGGGSSKDIWTPENWEPSLLLISVEDAGVGGCWGRGIVSLVVVWKLSGLVDCQWSFRVVLAKEEGGKLLRKQKQKEEDEMKRIGRKPAREATTEQWKQVKKMKKSSQISR